MANIFYKILQPEAEDDQAVLCPALAGESLVVGLVEAGGGGGEGASERYGLINISGQKKTETKYNCFHVKSSSFIFVQIVFNLPLIFLNMALDITFVSNYVYMGHMSAGLWE